MDTAISSRRHPSPPIDHAPLSPFERLSGELRNQIYDYVLDDVHSVVLRFDDALDLQLVPHPLSRTNRRLRAETMALYQTSFMSPDPGTSGLMSTYTRTKNTIVNVRDFEIDWRKLIDRTCPKNHDPKCRVHFKILVNGSRRDSQIEAGIEGWAAQITSYRYECPIFGGTYAIVATGKLQNSAAILSLTRRLRTRLGPRYAYYWPGAQVHRFLDAVEKMIEASLQDTST